MKKRRMIFGAALAIIALGAITAFIIWRHNAARRPQNTLTLYGNVDIREIQLAFKESNRIASMTVTEGTQVHKGQLLGLLDQHTYRLNRDLAKAQAQQRQAELAALLAGSRKEDIARLRAQLASARAELNSATLTYERTRRLARQNFASREKLDETQSLMKAARGRKDAAQAALDLAIAGPRQEDIAGARAAVSAAQAQVALAQQHLDDTRLTAPAAGIIRDRILEPGDMASPQTPVYTLAITQPVWVRAYVDEPDLGKLRPGMRAYITTDSSPGRRFTGWVGYISPTAEFTPKEVQTPQLRTELVYQVRVYACNSRGELRLGMPATVTVPLHQAPDVHPPDCANAAHERAQ